MYVQCREIIENVCLGVNRHDLLIYYMVHIECNVVRANVHCSVHYDLVISKQSFDSEPNNPWSFCICVSQYEKQRYVP